MSIRRLLLLAGVASLLAGCASTTPLETPRQLESGEGVISASLEWPGYYHVPRAGFYLMYAVGGVADISGHGGIGPGSLNYGLGTRTYPFDWMIVGVRGDMRRFSDDAELGAVSGEDAMFSTITPRILLVDDGDEFIYSGLQGTVIHDFTSRHDDQSGPKLESTGIGAVVGVDALIPVALVYDMGIQTELIVSMIGSRENSGSDVSLTPAVQLGISGYFLHYD